jgi:hypothetical protein
MLEAPQDPSTAAEPEEDLDSEDVYAELVPDEQYVRNRCRVFKQTVHFFVIEPRRPKSALADGRMLPGSDAAATDTAVLPTRLVTVRLTKRKVNGQRDASSTVCSSPTGFKSVMPGAVASANGAAGADGRDDVWQQTAREIEQSNNQVANLYKHIPHDAGSLCARLMRCVISSSLCT